MMTRTLLPVGQGACYLEQFPCNDSQITVMYDCGSITPSVSIENTLPAFLPCGSTIDALFISHFDLDHVNGLPFVLKNYNVRNLFLPLITEKECKLLQLYYAVFSPSNSTLPHLVSGDYQKSGLSILYVRPNSDGEIEYIRNGDVQSVHSGNNVFDIIFRSQGLVSTVPFWEFIPYNFRQKSRIKELLVALTREFGTTISLQEALDITRSDRNGISKIKRAFQTLKGNLNENSMVLFSGSTNDSIKQHLMSVCACPACSVLCSPVLPQETPSGCLYMGDYNASGTQQWSDLHSAFSTFWDRIGCLQIPHHGSRNSYNSLLTECLSRYFFISAGTHNRYRHPHKDVLEEMQKKSKYPLWITENPASVVVLIV